MIGGPQGDTGLTGRKIIVDTYGGMARHGGGAFSGKDPSKVDRSRGVPMRYVAKNVVAAGLAGAARCSSRTRSAWRDPVGLYVETFGTDDGARRDDPSAIREVSTCARPRSSATLDLLRPIYRKTATYGHFGRDLPDFTWERTDRVDDLLSLF